MNDSLGESISALIDSEVKELELHLALKSIDSDEALRQKWRRYQIAIFSMRRQMDCRFDLDISERVAAAIIDEPAIIVDNNLLTNLKSKISSIRPVFKPMLSAAVAASVAFLVVFVVQFSEQGPANKQIVVGEQTLITNLIVSKGDVVSDIHLTAHSQVMTPSEKRVQSLIENHIQQARLSKNRGLMPVSYLIEGLDAQEY